VATTGRWNVLSGGRIPWLAEGTKLVGAEAIWGAVCVGWRLFTSAGVTRADVIGPWPK